MSELPPWAAEYDSLNSLDWAASSLDTATSHLISFPSGCVNQQTVNNLSQDVIAAGKEIDSIVSELWRSAIRGSTDNFNVPPNQSSIPIQYSQSGVLLSVFKSSSCEDHIEEALNNPDSCVVTQISEANVLSKLLDESQSKTRSKNKCDQCDKCYTWHNDLVKHRKTHSGEHYSCPDCKKSYSLKSDLLKHQRVHSHSKGSLCKHCGKSFSSKGDLHKHVRTHTGERPYHCKICEKSFSASDNYHKHVRIHSGERPLSCIECGQRFLKNSNLQQHRRIHLGEKPFQCDLCGLTFTQKTHMKNHLSTHSGLKPFSCVNCGQCFTRNADLNRHTKRAHDDRTGNRSL